MRASVFVSRRGIPCFTLSPLVPRPCRKRKKGKLRCSRTFAGETTRALHPGQGRYQPGSTHLNPEAATRNLRQKLRLANRYRCNSPTVAGLGRVRAVFCRQEAVKFNRTAVCASPLQLFKRKTIRAASYTNVCVCSHLFAGQYVATPALNYDNQPVKTHTQSACAHTRT